MLYASGFMGVAAFVSRVIARPPSPGPLAAAALLTLAALLLLEGPPRAMAAPSPRHSPSGGRRPHGSPSRTGSHAGGHARPKWVDPCGLQAAGSAFAFTLDPGRAFAAVPERVPLSVLLQKVVSPTRKAKQHADNVKQQFVSSPIKNRH